MSAPTLATPSTLKVRSHWRSVLRGSLRHPGARIGLAVFGAIVLLAVLAPVISPYDPIKQDARLGLSAPSAAHPLGTDDLGRNLLARILFGAQLSLLVAFGAVSVSTLAGVAVGLVSGYFQGWIDSWLMRIVDVLLSFPGLLLALFFAAILGTGITSLVLAVGIAGIPNFARMARGAVLSASRNDYVEAARCIGCTDVRIMLQHILPNVVAPLIVLATLYVAFAVLTASSLSFLGVGVLPPTPEWGAMTNAGRNILYRAWWVSTVPALMIMLLVLAVNLVGDGLRDALDPSLRV